MFTWVKKMFSQSWDRRSHWSPLLQSQREFQRSLSKERSRVDRHGGLFGFIILRLCDMRGAKAQVRQLADLLHRRLRETDEKGQLGPGRIGVILPLTDSAGTQLVLASIIELARKCGLRIDGECFVYPEQQSGGPDGERRDSSHGDRQEIPVGQAISSDPSMVQAMPIAMMVSRYPFWKRCLDVTGALTGLVISSPIMLVSAILIKITSPGPVLFCQQRTGYLGREFTIYKFRSMVVNAPQMQSELRERNERDGPAFKITRDPRTTSIGRFLRATGFDELPQLYNVLRGDMALVGPRPLPVNEAAQCLPWQQRREEAKPGLTCFWQIAKSRSITFPDWMRLDLSYVRKASLGLDLRLLARTVIAVFMGRVGH